MQARKIVGNVVSNVALLKSIRKTKYCCFNNQENYERNLILGENLNSLMELI
jgi:hypothetical protein